MSIFLYGWFTFSLHQVQQILRSMISAPKDLETWSDNVDGFSFMTCDFSGPHRPGPNAPLSWIRSSLQLILGDADNVALSSAPKIFLGISFYGNDFVLPHGVFGCQIHLMTKLYLKAKGCFTGFLEIACNSFPLCIRTCPKNGGGAITGRDYLSLLERHEPELQWKEEIAEHFFLYSENHIGHAFFHPSLMSIHMRLAEARAWGVGLSIWEIGQGLGYFWISSDFTLAYLERCNIIF